MEDFDMDAVDNLEQENDKSPQKKSHQPSGIAMEALAGLLDSYSTTEMKVRYSFSINQLNASLSDRILVVQFYQYLYNN
jgi:hypothetical protein